MNQCLISASSHAYLPLTTFKKLDLTKGLFQIPLHPESRKITGFKTPCGLYQFKVVPFGLTNAPSVFNQCMPYVLGDFRANLYG